MSTVHRFERRSQMLASRMRAQTDALALQMGAGSRPPFTEAMTRNESLAWWREHRHDEWGKTVLERYTPLDIVRLDAELGAHIDAERQGSVYGGPEEVA